MIQIAAGSFGGALAMAHLLVPVEARTMRKARYRNRRRPRTLPSRTEMMSLLLCRPGELLHEDEGLSDVHSKTLLNLAARRDSGRRSTAGVDLREKEARP